MSVCCFCLSLSKQLQTQHVQNWTWNLPPKSICLQGLYHSECCHQLSNMLFFSWPHIQSITDFYLITTSETPPPHSIFTSSLNHTVSYLALKALQFPAGLPQAHLGCLPILSALRWKELFRSQIQLCHSYIFSDFPLPLGRMKDTF